MAITCGKKINYCNNGHELRKFIKRDKPGSKRRHQIGNSCLKELSMATKFPKRRSNNWIPFVRNQTLVTVLAVFLSMQLLRNLALELLVGTILIIGNGIPFKHHIASEWAFIWSKKNWRKIQGIVSFAGKKQGFHGSNLVRTIHLPGCGDASIVRVSPNAGAVYFSDLGYENRMCYLGVWLIPASSHLLLSSRAEQGSTLAQWGRLLAAIAGQQIKRLQFFTDIIVTTATGPKDTLRRLMDFDPGLDKMLTDRYAEVASAVGGHVYERRCYLVVEFAKIGADRTEALKMATEQIDRTIRGMIQNARLLSPDELTELISGAMNPETAFLRSLLESYGPAAASLVPAEYNIAASQKELILPYHLSRTYVITEFPQMAVADTWQLNLLGGIPHELSRYTLSYIFNVIDPQIALRTAEREANKVEMETLTRASGRGNQRIMSREYAEIESARETERDLTTGEAMLKGIATITITAESEQILDDAETWLTRQAGTCYMRLRRADWRHDEGWATSLPFCVTPLYFESHTLSTATAQSLYQAQIAAPLGVPGILLGRDDLSFAPFSWDPFELYAAHILTSPIAIVLGQVGTGKSTFSKLLALRGAGVHGYGFFALDPKGEYAGTAKELGLPYLRLAPGQTRINPLDLDSASAKAAMLAILASSVMERSLTPDEAAALDKTAELLAPGSALFDAVELLRKVPPEIVHSMGTPDRDESVRRLIPVVAGLQRYLGSGQLGGLFDGETSIDLNPKGMIINLSEAFRDPALFKPVSSVVAFWLRNAIANLAQRSFLIVDEGWAVLDNLASFLQTTTKLSRSYGVSLVLTMHGLSDVLGAANAGTAISGKLQTIIDAVQSAFIFSNSSNEIELIAKTFTLTQAEQEILNLDDAGSNYRGLFLAMIGGSHYLCRTMLAERDSTTTDTDQNMASSQVRVSRKNRGSDPDMIFDAWS